MNIVDPGVGPEDQVGPKEKVEKGEFSGHKVRRKKSDKADALLDKQKEAPTTDQVPDRIRHKVTPSLKRTRSLPDLKPLQAKDKAKAERHGELWECIDRVEGQHGGFIYKYRIREEFVIGKSDQEILNAVTENLQVVTEKILQIFPAVEAIPFHPGGQLNLVPILFDRDTGELFPLLKELGYSYENGILSLPDLEALKKGWKELQSRYPNLPDFDIVSSEGIADDITFATSSLSFDALLSRGKEFVHDHLFHVIPVIKLLSATLVSDPGNLKYQDIKINLVKGTLAALRRFAWAEELLNRTWPSGADEVTSRNVRITRLDLEQLAKGLGAVVDDTSTEDTLRRLEAKVESFGDVPRKLEIQYWKILQERLYPENTYNTAHLEEVWRELGRLEIDYLNELLADKPLEKMNNPFYRCISESKTEQGTFYTFQVNDRYTKADEKTNLDIRSALYRMQDPSPKTFLALKLMAPNKLQLELTPPKEFDKYKEEYLKIKRLDYSLVGFSEKKIDELIGDLLDDPESMKRIQKSHSSALQAASLFQALGYRYQKTEEGIVFTAPNRQTVQRNWEQVQKIYPKIASFEEIITDLTKDHGEGSQPLTDQYFLSDHFRGPIQAILFQAGLF